MELLALLLLALVVGAVMPVQAGINAQLGGYVGGAVAAALVSFAVGTATLAAVWLGLRTQTFSLESALKAPWGLWLGGTIGAFIVTGSVILAPRLGAASMLALMVAGQMSASLLLDHYGILGFPVHAVSPARLLGAVLIVAGVVLVQRF